VEAVSRDKGGLFAEIYSAVGEKTVRAGKYCGGVGEEQVVSQRCGEGSD
jgi:hypothetical protein